jgi:dihydropteroate synthase
VIASGVTARAAARYNIRLLLTSTVEALRADVVGLGIDTRQLGVLSSHAAMEALAVENLDPQQVAGLHDAINDGGGALLTDTSRTRAVVVAPVLTAAALNGRLQPWGPAAMELGAAIAEALVARGAPPAPITARGHRLEFGRHTLVMGVVNATPDSFSGDGVGDNTAAAVALAERMVADGADVIDVGGESTRPNSAPVPADEELRRVLPVVTTLARTLPVPVSIDTHKAEVARAALDAGVAIVNDVWGLRGDAAMAAVVAQHADCAVVVMHNQRGIEYQNLLADVCRGLRESIAIASDAGVAAERIIIDPGFGFAKTPAQNLEVLRRLYELRTIGRPMLAGLSRKSTIGILTGGAPPDQRVEGGLALATLAVQGGADVVRTHDVRETVRALRVADAVVRGTPPEVLELPATGPTG